MSDETKKEVPPGPAEPQAELSEEELGNVAGGRDAGSGIATGKRQYHDLHFVHLVDKSSSQ